MERYGRSSEGSRSDPSPEWTGTGGETGLEGIAIALPPLTLFFSFLVHKKKEKIVPLFLAKGRGFVRL